MTKLEMKHLLEVQLKGMNMGQLQDLLNATKSEFFSREINFEYDNEYFLSAEKVSSKIRVNYDKFSMIRELVVKTDSVFTMSVSDLLHRCTNEDAEIIINLMQSGKIIRIQ